jgi:peptidoglycan/LPS O-acetylase OafA/YrhL
VLTRSDSSPLTDTPSAEGSIPTERRHLAALDGLRFIAAFSVLAGHGYWYVVQQQNTAIADGVVATVLRQLPGLGMTLFFVLSGFVIHFNYHTTVGYRRGGNFDFFIARFSRLYPLFLVVFMVDLVHILSVQGYFAGRPLLNFDPFGPLPAFLSFTQTWLFVPFDGYPIYEHYGAATSNAQATGAMWSLSTEWLFYMVYPLLSVWLARRHGRGLAFLGAAAVAAGLLYYGWCAYNIAAIQSFGLARFGSPQLAGSFIGWMVFYSPLGRMIEFILGALAAQRYLSGPSAGGLLDRLPISTTPVLGAAILCWLVAAPLLHLHVAGVGASCAAGLIALFVLLLVLHKTRTTVILSSPLLVKCGEASYSLYLLHWYVMHQWAAPYAYPFGRVGRVLMYVAGIAVSIALARVVYLLFEKPALRWLRRNFKPLRLHLVIGVAFVLVTGLSVAASLQVHAVKRFCAANPKPDCSSLGIVPPQQPAN